MRNISEQRAIEQELEEKTRAIDGSVTATAIAAPDGTLTYVNHAFLELWGEPSAGSVLGRNAGSFWMNPHNGKEVIEAVRQNDSWSGEMTARRRDGSTFPVSFSANVMRAPDGTIEYLMGTWVDVTERTHAETQMRRQADRFNGYLRATLDGYWLVDEDTCIIDVNEAACNMLGYTRDEMLHMRLSDIEVGESPEEIRERVQRLVENGTDRFESRNRTKDGTIIDVEVSVTLVGLETQSTRLIAFIKDISEQKQKRRIEREKNR